MNEILVDRISDTCIVKIRGKATMKISQSVEELISKENKTPILDFSEADHIDSTFLGLVAKYTMFFKQKNDEYLSVLKPTKEVLEILDKTGISKFLIIIDKEILINAKKIENLNFDNSKIANHILELHEILMNLNEENKKEFAAVVEQMKKVVGK